MVEHVFRSSSLSFFLTLAFFPPAGGEPAQPAPESPPQSGIRNPESGMDLYGDPLPPGAIARMGTVRPLHEGNVSSIAFSPDGTTLASGSGDNTIRLWEAATGKELPKLVGHERDVRSVAFSPDGNTVASGSADKTIRLWNAATGKEYFRLEGHSASVSSVAFSPDGKILVSGGFDRTVRLWELATGKEIFKLEGHMGPVHAVAYSPDGKTLASGSEDGTIRMWETDIGKEFHKLEGNGGTVFSVVFSPDGKRLASGYAKETALIWDIASIRRPIRWRSSWPTQDDFWCMLASHDVVQAWFAVMHMDRVSCMKDRLKPIPVDEKRIKQFVRELNHDDEIVRGKAALSLIEMGEVASIAIARAMYEMNSPEVKARCDQIFEVIDRPFPVLGMEFLRRWRAIQVLERIGTKEAREVLEMLETESNSLRERHAAKAALDRLDRLIRK